VKTVSTFAYFFEILLIEPKQLWNLWVIKAGDVISHNFHGFSDDGVEHILNLYSCEKMCDRFVFILKCTPDITELRLLSILS